MGALDCAEQGPDCVGGRVWAGSSAQHSDALRNVVLGGFAHLPVMACCQERCQEDLKGCALSFAGHQRLEESLEGVQSSSLHSTAGFHPS